MSPIRRHVAVLAALAALTLAGAAGAQPSAAARPTTTRTADYTETTVAGDQVVQFTGDELAAPGGGPYGDVIRRPPGVLRALLIRPRLNFVPELLKTVENL